MNYIELQDKLKSDPELIIKILEHLEYIDIRDKHQYYSARNPDGDNEGALVIWKDSLKYMNYTRGHSGNIISLVMNDKRCSFPQALDNISHWTGIKTSDIKIVHPFGGFYKNIVAEQNGRIPELEEYSRLLLPPADNFSLKFVRDNIDVQTQKEFGIRYSLDDDAILMPIDDINGRLVGCKARANSEIDMAHRYFAWLPYQKSSVVYGLCQNYLNIINKNTAVIYESEKAVCQSKSYGLDIGLGIAGHNISNTQANIIKGLMCDKIIVAFDEGICEEEMRHEAKKLVVDNTIYKNKVYYLYDREHRFLVEGSKDSPSDHGKLFLKNMLKECKYAV